MPARDDQIAFLRSQAKKFRVSAIDNPTDLSPSLLKMADDLEMWADALETDAAETRLLN